MFKQIMYAISALIILIVLSFLIYLKFIRSNTKGEEKIVTQTIIPIVSSQIDNENKKPKIIPRILKQEYSWSYPMMKPLLMLFRMI